MEPFDGESVRSQNLNEQPGQEDIGIGSLGVTVDEIEAEGKLKEYYAKYFPNKNNGQQSEAPDLLEQLAIADRMALFLFSPPKLESMGKEEQEAYASKIARKTSVYDFSKHFGVNLYNWEAGRFLKKITKQKDKLESQLDTFLSELRGGTRKASNGELYAEVLKDIPDYMKQDSKYQALVGYINERATGSRNGKGLRDGLREVEEGAIWLADFDDFLYGAMTKLDGIVEQATTNIKGINEKLAVSPQDKALMQQRAQQNALLMKYKADREKFAYVRDDIANRLDVSEYEIDSIQDRVSVREVAVAKSRRSLARLNAAINRIENYRQSKQDMVVVTDHVMTVEQAHEYIGQAEGVGIIFSGFAKRAYRNLAKQEADLGDAPYAASNRELQGMVDSMKTERDERVESLKARLRKQVYT
ncbi:MAG: hypothetical protein ABIH72_02665 [archaeon]